MKRKSCLTENREKIRVYKSKHESLLHDFPRDIVEINVVCVYSPLLVSPRKDRSDQFGEPAINKTSGASIEYRAVWVSKTGVAGRNYFFWFMEGGVVFNLSSVSTVEEMTRSLKMIHRERIFTRISLQLFFLILYPKRGSVSEPVYQFYSSLPCLFLTVFYSWEEFRDILCYFNYSRDRFVVLILFIQRSR